MTIVRESTPTLFSDASADETLNDQQLLPGTLESPATHGGRLATASTCRRRAVGQCLRARSENDGPFDGHPRGCSARAVLGCWLCGCFGIAFLLSVPK
ncbi:hypothetical protein [Burkholderia stagnalis]|uniref:hypothetical protein n=1 Tax=Burkholderia stagnalis TaxID=1503054 RepID=UPI000B161316|nr:hypothetical protein [Burkholderia stagnalis]